MAEPPEASNVTPPEPVSTPSRPAPSPTEPRRTPSSLTSIFMGNSVRMPPEPVFRCTVAPKSCGTVTRTLPEPVSMSRSAVRFRSASVTPPEPVSILPFFASSANIETEPEPVSTYRSDVVMR